MPRTFTTICSTANVHRKTKRDLGKPRSPKKAKPQTLPLGRIDGAVRSGSASPIDELSTRRGRRRRDVLVPDRIIAKRVKPALDIIQLECPR